MSVFLRALAVVAICVAGASTARAADEEVVKRRVVIGASFLVVHTLRGHDSSGSHAVFQSAYVGYRWRQRTTSPLGAFTLFSLDLAHTPAPFHYDRHSFEEQKGVGLIGPTARFGWDLRFKKMKVSTLGVYGIVGAHRGPRWSYDYGTRVGIGFVYFTTPFNNFEITVDTYYRGTQVVRYNQVRIGFGFY